LDLCSYRRYNKCDLGPIYHDWASCL